MLTTRLPKPFSEPEAKSILLSSPSLVSAAIIRFIEALASPLLEAVTLRSPSILPWINSPAGASSSFLTPTFKVEPASIVTLELKVLYPKSKIPPSLTVVAAMLLPLSATMAVPDTSIVLAVRLTASLASISLSGSALTLSKLSRMKVEPSFTAKVPISDAEPKSVDTDVLALIFNVPSPARVLMVEPALFTLIFESVSTLILASMIPPFKSTEAFSKATSEPLVALIKAPSATLTSLLFKVIVPSLGSAAEPLAP
ncbi:unknown [Proteobacteria bacterium CAG:495]|nr:unknown [Proteobacteria bacterium CAG:495]